MISSLVYVRVIAKNRGVDKQFTSNLLTPFQRIFPPKFSAKYVYKIGSLEEDDSVNQFPKPLTSRLKMNENGEFNGRIGGIVELLKREIMTHGPVRILKNFFFVF